MKNEEQQGRMNPTIMKKLALSVIVSSMAVLAGVAFNVLPMSPTIEILATMVAFSVVLLSLHYVYLEHQAALSMENQLTDELVATICAEYPSTQSQTINEGIRNVLNTQPSHLLRIQALEYYKKDRLALDHFLQRLNNTQNRSYDYRVQ